MQPQEGSIVSRRHVTVKPSEPTMLRPTSRLPSRGIAAACPPSFTAHRAETFDLNFLSGWQLRRSKQLSHIWGEPLADPRRQSPANRPHRPDLQGSPVHAHGPSQNSGSRVCFSLSCSSNLCIDLSTRYRDILSLLSIPSHPLISPMLNLERKTCRFEHGR